jgi:hypothetical protein
MKKEDIIYLEVLVEEMLNNLFESDLLDEDVEWDENGRIGESKEEKCIKKIINILEEKISYY